MFSWINYWSIRFGSICSIFFGFKQKDLTYPIRLFPSQIRKNKTFCAIRGLQGVVIMISSIYFANSHLSTWGTQSFLYYFVGGVIYGGLFLRFGFLSTIL
ncbi:MAG: CPBP family intramembrane metalloprotease [Candidatus Heimdallarchaeota archaeon]|nr:CPBP family intramembrane metalloprotease [Candidatus Heimdallarchaeota archaeon]